MRRRLTCVAATALGLAASGVSAGLTSPIAQGNISVRLRTIVTGPPGALDLTHAGDGSNRLFVANQGGQVRVIQNNTLQGTPFLDLPATLGPTFPSPVVERGLLGISFHPDFNAPAGTPGAGKFYTFTSETKVGTPDFTHPEIGAGGGTHHAVVREWTVSSSNPNAVDTSQGSRALLRIAWPADNHIGGALKFGPDKNLYISLGDGGNANDLGTGHTDGIGNGQDVSNVYGDILRINPIASVASNGNLSANGQYRIPTDNPFVNAAGVDEIYAYGFRNPFRMSFDRKTGALYVGDVGQGNREEVDVVEKGKNYGWFYYEGSVVKNPGGPSNTVFPIAEYLNRAQAGGEGNAVIGGFVYRGFRHPELHGKYVFGDFAGKFGPGRLFYLDAGNVIREFRYDANSATINSELRGFGEGPRGELYALFSSGQVMQLGGGPVQWEVNGSGTWQTAGNWSNGVVPNDYGAVANLMGGVTTPNQAPAVVTLTTTARLGTLRFFNDTVNPDGSSPYTYILVGPPAGLDIQTANNNTVSALIAADAGHHFIDTGVSIFAHTELRAAENSSLTFAQVFNNNNGRTIRKTGPGAVFFDTLATGSFTLLDVGEGTVTGRALSSETISVQAGARLAAERLFNVRNLQVAAGGEAKLLAQESESQPSVVQTLSVAGGATPTGTLDLNHRLRVWNPDPATLAAQIRHARNGGLYDRPGITSEMAEQSNHTKTVGLLPDGMFGAILDVTYFGDTDLDGDLDADDYHRLDTGFLRRLSGWHNGDADHSGVIDLMDYALVDHAYRSIDPSSAAAMIDEHAREFGEAYVAALAAVPEPSVVSLFVAGAALVGRRRRKLEGDC